MKIGIFGGSFDPVHNGHLVLAEHVRDRAGLDRVILLPAYESPFKVGRSGTDSRHRLEMTRLAASGNEHFEVSALDVEKGKVSYTVDLMAELSDMYPGDRLYFIAGTDSFLGIEKWMGSEELLTRYGFAVGTRPGYRDEELAAQAERLREKYGSEIITVNIPKVDISSTDIRRRCRDGRSIRYLVPDAVRELIAREGLYRG